MSSRSIVVLAVLTLLIATGGALAKAVKNSTRCKAMVLRDAGPADGAIISVCKGDLSVHKDGRTLYATSLIPEDDGYVTVESLGKPMVDKKNGLFVLPFKSAEEMPEYMGKAKGRLVFDGRKWRAECGQESCEVLPAASKTKTSMGKMSAKSPTSKKCDGRAIPAGKFGLFQTKFIGCKSTGEFYVFTKGKRVFDLADVELEQSGSLEFHGLKSTTFRGGTMRLSMTVKETTEPVAAGMGDPPPAESRNSKASLLMKGSSFKLRCAAKKCLLLESSKRRRH